MKTGPDYRSEHTLADGTRIVVRHIRPEDAALLREAFARLSPESRYRRFFGSVSELSDEMVRYLTEVDGQSHVALVAGIESPDLKGERGLGVARFIRSADDPGAAEAAVTVIDDMQQKGIGHILLSELSEAARERGIKRFRGQVLASNEPARRILTEVGAVVRREDAETVTFEVELSPVGAPEKDSALRRLLREAASSMAVLVLQLRPERREE